MSEYEEEEAFDGKKIGLIIAIPVVAAIVGLIYFGVIPIDLEFPEAPVIEEPIKVEEAPEPEPEPVITEKVVENELFEVTEEGSLLPTTPQIIDQTPENNTKSLVATTPQITEVVQTTGNLDDIESKYRKYLSFGVSIDTILFFQNNECSQIPTNMTVAYPGLAEDKGC